MKKKINIDKVCVRWIKGKKGGICGKPRTGTTGLIPYCEKHYKEIWG